MEPTNETLLRLCLEQGLDANSPEFTEIAEQSPEMAERVAHVLSFASLVREVGLETPPEHVQRAARSVGLVEQPTFRSWLAKLWVPKETPALAYRGHAAAPALYQAGPYEISILRTSNGTVVGEVVRAEDGEPPASPGFCRLFGEAGDRRFDLNAEGEFRVEGLEAGPWKLVVVLEEGTLVVPELDI
jgi:hypothetical protein